MIPELFSAKTKFDLESYRRICLQSPNCADILSQMLFSNDVVGIIGLVGVDAKK